MLLTPHAMVGAAIGASTDNLVYIIILAFMSHFILDALPHFDWGTWHGYKEFELERKDYVMAGIDIAMVLIFTYYLWHNTYDNKLLIGAFFAILPDLFDNVPFWKDTLRKYAPFKHLHSLHKLIHFQIKEKYWIWGILTQITIILLALIILKIF